MPDTFILGAGFSKAISNRMPLLQELSDQIRGTFGDLELRHSLPSGDLEIWLSYLTQTHPWLREQDNLRNRALALDISQRIKDLLSEKEHRAIENECPKWMRRLACYWHLNRSSVITLNYDTIVERAASEYISINDGIMPEDLYPIPLTLSTARNAATWGRPKQYSFTLFKLHGSVNWYYSGASAYTGEALYYSAIRGWGTALDSESESEHHVNDKVPLIVPPTTEKSGFFQHESLRHMWAQASQAVGLSNRLFVVGYSLPVTDLTIRLFLLEGASLGTSTKTLYVVNSDIESVDHYRYLLGDAFEINVTIWDAIRLSDS